MCIYLEHALCLLLITAQHIFAAYVGSFSSEKFKERFKCQAEEQKENVIITILKLDKVKPCEAQRVAATSVATSAAVATAQPTYAQARSPGFLLRSYCECAIHIPLKTTLNYRYLFCPAVCRCHSLHVEAEGQLQPASLSTMWVLGIQQRLGGGYLAHRAILLILISMLVPTFGDIFRSIVQRLGPTPN